MTISKTIQTRLTVLEQRLKHNGTGRRKTLDDFYRELAAGTSGIDAHYPNVPKHPKTSKHVGSDVG